MEVTTNEEVKTEEQLIEEKRLKNKKKRNIDLYKSYRTFAYDLMFYYAIEYLFLTVEKGLNAAQVLKFNAFYILFKFITQIPVTLLIQRVGKKNSIVIANVICAMHLFIIIFANNFEILIFSQFLSAICFTIKATCETDMLYDSIEHGEERGSIFSKIDGKSLSRHFYFEAISAVIAGLLFVTNHYIPMVLCLVVSLFTTFISTKFENVEVKEKAETIGEELKKIRYATRNIFKSKRLTTLLFFNSLMVAMFKILQSLRNAILVEVEMPQAYFGIIFAILGIISGIAAKNQNRIHKRYRNRTLTFLGFPTASSILILGILLSLDVPNIICIPIILGLFVVQYIMKGPYYVLIKRYFNNFTTSEKRVKIATINNLIENLIASILVFASSAVVDLLPINTTLIIIGCIFVFVVVLLLDKMRHTVGLKMEEYSKKEIL